MSEWSVRDHVVVVSGGSRGIGLGIVEALARRGARVVALARDEARLRQAIAGLHAANVTGHSVDVCDKTSLERVYERIWDEFGRLDAVVNNVGRQFTRRIELTREDEVREIVTQNLLSTIFGCQVATPWLRRNGGGRILNVSSSSVRDDNEFSHIGVYVSCKAAVDRFTEELRRELRPDGILVTLFSSGGVNTGSIERYDPEAVAEAYQAWLENGKYYGGYTTPDVMGEAIARCLEYPPGLAPEFIEVKTGLQTEKALEE